MSRPRRSRQARRPRRTPLRLAGRALALAFALLLAYQGWFFVHVWWWKDHDPASTRFMRLQERELRNRHAQWDGLQHTWVAYPAISHHLKRAVVAAEDDRFMQHNGFDWQGIQHAIERNRARPGARAGGSTITQQLAKNLFLSPRQSYVRKAQEAVITVMLEALWSKERILEVYLNVAEWGEGVFGCGAAAQHYFSLSADRLGPGEAARLAVMLPNPRRYEHEFGPRLTRHAERVRGRMMHSRIP